MAGNLSPPFFEGVLGGGGAVGGAFVTFCNGSFDDNRINVSFDGGDTWAQSEYGSIYEDVSTGNRADFNGELVFVATDIVKTLYRTGDGSVFSDDGGNINPGLMIATNGSIITALNTTAVETSINAVDWTSQGTAVAGWGPAWCKYISGFGLFFAGDYQSSPKDVNYYTSTDGINWTTRTFAEKTDASNWIGEIEYSSSLGLAVWLTVAGNIYTSTSGTSWTYRANISNGYAFGGKSLVWNSVLGAFFASCNNLGNTIFSSTDGINWSEVSGNNLSSVFSSMPRLAVNSTGGMVGHVDSTGISASTSYTGYSSDGVTWTRCTNGFNGNWLFYSSSLSA